MEPKDINVKELLEKSVIGIETLPVSVILELGDGLQDIIDRMNKRISQLGYNEPDSIMRIIDMQIITGHLLDLIKKHKPE